VAAAEEAAHKFTSGSSISNWRQMSMTTATVMQAAAAAAVLVHAATAARAVATVDAAELLLLPSYKLVLSDLRDDGK
jgi:hypothetical protein